VKTIVEEQADKMASITVDDCHDNSGYSIRFQRETNATEMGIKKPFWFRLLLRIPELPSTVYMPAIAGLLCYFFLPTFIIGAYVLAFLYIILSVPYPWVYLCIAGIIMPSLIVSLSAKAHSFWNYWQCLTARKTSYTVTLEQAIEEYVALVKHEEAQ